MLQFALSSQEDAHSDLRAVFTGTLSCIICDHSEEFLSSGLKCEILTALEPEPVSIVKNTIGKIACMVHIVYRYFKILKVRNVSFVQYFEVPYCAVT